MSIKLHKVMFWQLDYFIVWTSVYTPTDGLIWMSSMSGFTNQTQKHKFKNKILFNLTFIIISFMTHKNSILELIQGLINPLARCPWLVISTFGLAEIISCMPDGLVKIYIGYWQTCQYSCIYLYSYMLYVV